MEFNPEPTRLANEVSSNQPQPIFIGTTVVKVNEQTHLGLILQPGLPFEIYLNEKTIKAKKNIGIFKDLPQFLSLETLNQTNKSLVGS